MAWMVNLTHYLDSEGRLAAGLPAAAMRHVRYFGAITAAATATLDEVDTRTFVRCRKRPGRKPCPGLIQDDLVEPVEPYDGQEPAKWVESLCIHWHCPTCGDYGVITGWADSPWDRAPGSTMLTDCLSP